MCAVMKEYEDIARNEGLREGEARGLMEGRKEGRREFSYETAKNMIADNMPINLIMKYTGLTEAQLLQCREETVDYK